MPKSLTIKTNNWKKEMKQMKLRYIEKTSPGFFELSGGFSMEVKDYSDKTANGLTKSIVDYLKFKGWFVHRNAECIRATLCGRHIAISVVKLQNQVDFVAKDMPSFIDWFENSVRSSEKIKQ